MPYRLSRARREFESEVTQLVEDLRVAHKSAGVSSAVRSHVTCSCVLLCMARLEGYIQDVVSEWVRRLGRGATVAASLPATLRALYLHDGAIVSAYKHYLLSGDESRFLDAVSRTLGSSSLQLASDVAVVPFLEPKRATAKKYPSPDNVKRLFARLGIPNVFQQLNMSSRSDLKNALQSFNDVRTAVAHDGVPPGSSYKDIKRQLLEMKQLVAHMDRLLYGHAVRYGGPGNWPT